MTALFYVNHFLAIVGQYAYYFAERDGLYFGLRMKIWSRGHFLSLEIDAEVPL
jgi:hypothetical protein